jgi:hypothetical protein
MRQLHNWDSFLRHVEFLEKLYWEKDEVVADAIDEITVDLSSDNKA